MDFIPNPFAPLPPPAIFSNAVLIDLDGEAIVPVATATATAAATPPLILREDLFDVEFITQQYEVGLYLAIYTELESTPKQTGLDCHDDNAFHKDLRENYNKEELTFIPKKSSKLKEEVTG